MNKGFKIIWNPVRRTYVVAAETAKAYGKKSGRIAAVKKQLGCMALALCIPVGWAEDGAAMSVPSSSLKPSLSPKPEYIEEVTLKSGGPTIKNDMFSEYKKEKQPDIHTSSPTPSKKAKRVRVSHPPLDGEANQGKAGGASPSVAPNTDENKEGATKQDNSSSLSQNNLPKNLGSTDKVTEDQPRDEKILPQKSNEISPPNNPITFVAGYKDFSWSRLTDKDILINDDTHQKLLKNARAISFLSGQLTISQANPDLQAAVSLYAGQTTLKNVAALGKSDIRLGKEANLKFEQASGELHSTLGGEGTVSIDSTSHIILPRTHNSSAFTGNTVVAGTLVVNGALGGTVEVQPDARLQGSGTMDTLVVQGKGTFAPGNSIGNPTIKKYLKLEDDSVVEIEIAPDGRSDHIEVAGKAELGRTHLVVIGEGSSPYKANTQYTILTAREGVFGSFIDMKKESLPFIDLALNQDDNHVYLNVTRNSKTLAEVAATSNQAAVAKAISSLSSGELYGLIINSHNTSAAQRAFDLLSGEMYASQQSFFVNDSHHLRDAAIHRLQRKADTTTDQPSAWGKGYGAWGNYASPDAAKLGYQQSGVLLGSEGLSNNWRLGMLGGYGHSRLKVNDRHSRAKVDSYHIGLYTGTQVEQWNIRLGTGYSWNKTALTRHPEVNRQSFTNNADYRTHTLQFFGELSYPLHFDQIAIEPMLNIAHVRVKSPAFKEGGHHITALQSESQHNQVTFSTLGVQATKNLTVQRTEVMLQGGLGWRHAYGEVKPTTRLNFAGSDPFKIQGVAVAKDTAVINAGAALQVNKHTRVGLHYAGSVAKKAHENSVQANVVWKF
jgi:outer membrane autotransporter protein